MATFEHRRYPALTLQDEKGIWAQFTEEQREFGEHKVRVGVLTTDDPKLIARLRAATETDSDLVEVGASGSAKAVREQLIAEGYAKSGPTETGEDDERLAALRAEADQLGVKLHHSMKADTIERKIAEAKAEQ